MEDALVHPWSEKKDAATTVLILVLMEDALVQSS